MNRFVEFLITVILCTVLFATLEWVFGNYNVLTSNVGGVVIGVFVAIWGVFLAPTLRR